MPPLKVEAGRVVRTPFNELVEQVTALEAALRRAEAELLAQKIRLDELINARMSEHPLATISITDTYSARNMAEARQSQGGVDELFTSMNFYA